MKLRGVVIENPFEKKRLWCGPAVISAITGFPVSHVVETIKDVKVEMGEGIGYRWVGKCGEQEENQYRLPVKGMHTGEVRYTLQRYGYNLVDSFYNAVHRNLDTLRMPTTASWLKTRNDKNELNLIVAGYHYQLVKGVKLVDSWTVDPVFIRKAPRRRARMKKVYRVVKIESRKQLVYKPK